MERRTKSRIDVRLTCFVEGGKAEATPVRALTENVSRTGILMLWGVGSPLPQVDGKLALDVLLPENSEFGPRVMRCRTVVIRIIHRGEGGHEVALRVLSMRFINPRAGGKTGRGKVSGKRRIPKPHELASMPLASERVI